MLVAPSDRDNGCQFGALLKPSIAAIELRIFLNLNTPYLPQVKSNSGVMRI